MKITKNQLKQIIKEELDTTMEEGKFPFPDGTTRDYDWKVDAEIEDKLVNAVLDLQELRGDAHVIRLLREMANDIEKEMAEKDGPTMQEGMFGDIAAKINAGIEQILDLPIGMAVGGLIVYLKYKHPRSDFDMMELSKNEAAMGAFINKLKSKEYDGRQFAKDWTNQDMTRDELMSKYFS